MHICIFYVIYIYCIGDILLICIIHKLVKILK